MLLFFFFGGGGGGGEGGGGGGIFSLAIYCFSESRKCAMLVSFVSVLHMFMIVIVNQTPFPLKSLFSKEK